MQQLEQAKVQMQQLQQTWCTFNNNSGIAETVSASAVEHERIHTPTLRSFCPMSMVEEPTDEGSVCGVPFGSNLVSQETRTVLTAILH